MAEKTSEGEQFKVVVVGDGAVGKTCMIMCYAMDVFPSNYIPTVFDAHTGKAKYDGKEVGIKIFDTAGQQDLARLRPVCYPGTQCFIVCFSLVDPISFANAKAAWRNELDQLGPRQCPKMLVGLKADLRSEFEDNAEQRSLCISTKMG